MKIGFHLLIAILVSSAITGVSVAAEDDPVAEPIASAITNENRTPADRKRDAISKPEVILGLLDLQSGQAAIDVFAGGGYFSELMAGVVGPDGTVILHNNYGYAKWVEKYIQERYIDNEVPPITVLRSEVDDLKLSPASVDVALMNMSYHDLYYYNPEAGFERADVPHFFRTDPRGTEAGRQIIDRGSCGSGRFG